MNASVPGPQPFAVEVDASSVASVICVRGDLDVDTAPELTRALSQLLHAGCTRLTVDLSEVPFIDSRGMSALVRGHVSSKALGTTMSIRGAVGNARRALEICGLLELLEHER